MDPERGIAELEAELAAKDARIAEQDARIEGLISQVAELSERLGRNSGNSNRPPSSDGPGARAQQEQALEGQATWWAAGHRGSCRALVPVERVDDFVDFYPSHCEHCCEALPKAPDPNAKRYQFTELPAFEPHTTEYRRHGVDCRRCGAKTWAA